MKSGDTKKGAGRQVSLLRHSDSTRAVLGAICKAHSAEASRLNEAITAAMKRHSAGLEADNDAMRAGRKSNEYLLLRLAREQDSVEKELPLEHDRAWTRFTETAAALRLAEASSGMNAHYAFHDVVPGAYDLVSSWDIGSNRYLWWRSVVVQPGAQLTADLDNDAVVSLDGACGHVLAP